ncbi:MAG: TerB family tellurite resistance protein [Cyanobacteriota bacterium SKYGB_h_bin112]|nr:TerB family tellurite resistance protein [Cyanobacteriota bacterium SKYGB_h_bin112]
MDLSLVDNDTVDLLTRITSKKLYSQDLTPTVLFLAALLTILLGVIFADTAVAYREEQRLQTMIDSLTPPGQAIKELAQFMIGGIDWHNVYINPADWMTLTKPLSYPERLLLISLGFEMSQIDGNMDPREITYLREVGHRLEICDSHLTILENSFAGHQSSPSVALDEIKQLLKPQQFAILGDAVMSVASNVLTQLR